MIVRAAKQEDLNQLIEINKNHTFPFPPDFSSMLDILVVEKEGRIVAWGYTKKQVEIVFVPDLDSPKPTIVKSLKLLSEKSSELTKERGISQVHCFVQDPDFAALLVERFGYGVCSGTALFLNVPNG